MAAGDVKQLDLGSWHSGVIVGEDTLYPMGSAGESAVDQTAISSTPRARNNKFTLNAGRVIPVKRDGIQNINATGFTGNPAILHQFQFRQRDTTTGSLSKYHLIACDNGRLESYDPTFALSTVSATAYTAGYLPPDFCVLHNLCFTANGTDVFKLDPRAGITSAKQNWGIVRPIIGSCSGNAGTAGDLDGEFEIRITYRNTTTGHESSASDTSASTVLCENKQLNIANIPVSPDSQVDQRRIYIREINTSKRFYLIDTVDDNVTTTATVNGIYENLVTEAPNTNENDPPPAGIKYVCTHRGRVFVATDSDLYWSKLNLPEAFDPAATDPVDNDGNERIMGLASYQGYLFIFKEHGYYVLDGVEPNTWIISRMDGNNGLTSFRSLVEADDGLYWWSPQGPIQLPRGQLVAPALLGQLFLSASISPKGINHSERHRIVSAYEPSTQRVYFAVPDAYQNQNTRIMVWNTSLRIWESERWDPVDASSLATVDDTKGIGRVMLGDYYGHIYQMNRTTNDGVNSGAVLGTFTPGTTSITAIATTFPGTLRWDATASDRLMGRKITLLDSTGVDVTPYIRPTITSNTSTVLQLDSAVGGLDTTMTYTVIVGGPDWQFDTAWLDFGNTFTRKRVEFVYLLGLLHAGSLYVDIRTNNREFPLQTYRLATVTGSGSLWNDGSEWGDGTLWNDSSATYDRIRTARHGTSFSLRFRSPLADEQIQLLKTGMRIVESDDKLG